MRHHLAWLTIAFLSLTPGTVLWGEEAVDPHERSAADTNRMARDEEKRVVESLAKRVNLVCDDTPLGEAIQRLSMLTGRDILIDVATLSDEGISTDQTVSLKLGETTMWQTLHFLLKPLSLTWVAQDGVLEVTTTNRADEIMVTHVYDVRKLCRLLEPLTKEIFERQRRPKVQMQGGMMGGGGFFNIPPVEIAPVVIGQMGGMGGMGMGQNAVRPAMVIKSVEAILACLVSECTQLRWEERDGEGGTIQLGQGCLIISQTYRGQFEIAGLLQALENLVDGKIHGKSVAARRLGYPIQEDAEIFEKLAAPKTLDLKDDSLADMLKQIADENGIRIWIDSQGLADEGISFDEQTGLRRRMQKLPLGICLKKILQPYHCTYVVEEGVLVVTTNEKANQMMSIRLYDISGVSKIGNETSDAGIVRILSQAARGNWQDENGEGGSATLVSSKHLAVLQTQRVHSDIALLLDELTREELLVPADPPLEMRIYTAQNVETARDLVRLLPQLVDSHWTPRGSIRQAGESLFINQPASVHERLEDLMTKLEESYLKRNPPAKDSHKPGDGKNSGQSPNGSDQGDAPPKQ